MFLVDFLFAKLEKNFAQKNIAYSFKNTKKATQILKKIFIFPLPQISSFSLGQKRCAYHGKSAYYEWAQ